MAERGLCTGKINYSIHDTIAVVIKVGQKMSYLHDFHCPIFVVGKRSVYLKALKVSHLCFEMARTKGRHFAQRLKCSAG